MPFSIFVIMVSVQQNARILITGRVQGVGFRYFTKRWADTLNLQGTVRNLFKGEVEVLVEGPREVLEEFIAVLREGPPGSTVRECRIDWRPVLQTFNGFSIGY